MDNDNSQLFGNRKLSDIIDHDSQLQHFGILGMKWGRRKGVTTGSQRASSSDDHNKAHSVKKKKLHELTNDELRMYNQRILLEKQYKELSKKPMGPAKKFVVDVLVKTGQETLNNYAKKNAAQMVEKALKSMEKAIK